MIDSTNTRPTSQKTRGGTLVSLSWVLVASAYFLIPLCLFLPVNLEHDSGLYATILWGTFLLRTFFFHGGLLIAVVAVLGVFRRRWRLVVGSLPVLLATLGPEILSYVPRSKPQVADPVFKLMSVNLLRHNVDVRLLDEVAQESPDVIFFQEYTYYWHEAIVKRLGKDYPHALHMPRDDSFGAVMFSRLPFVEGSPAILKLGGVATPQLRAAIQIGDRSLALYNLHILSPGSPTNVTVGRRQLSDLLERIRTGTEKLPVVVAGDFNFSQYSTQADWVRDAGLVESHREVGWGRGATWSKSSILQYLPGVRIDHVYYSRELASRECRRGVGAGSDHQPVVVSGIGWRQ